MNYDAGKVRRAIERAKIAIMDAQEALSDSSEAAEYADFLCPAFTALDMAWIIAMKAEPTIEGAFHG